MYLKAPDQSRAALQRSRDAEEPLFQAEQQVFGFDHTHVGHALLELWKLPMSLREAVLHHHHPDRAQRFPVEAAVVHVADMIVNALELGSSGESLVPPLVASAWDTVGLSHGVVEDIADEAERHYHAAVQVMALEAA
jgi:hypothetical protein